MSWIVAISALGALAGADDVTQSLFEVTEERLDEFKDSRAELEEICRVLLSLGDPRTLEKGESYDRYFERIDKIYTHRAHGLVLLQMEYEEALTTRYELEADLHFYLWEISNEHEGFAARQAERVKQKEAAKRESVSLKNEEIAVRKMLYEAAKREHGRLQRRPKPTWREQQRIAELADDARRCEAAKDAVVPDQLAIQEKYADQTIAQLREALRSLEVRAEAARFEYEYLEYELTPQDSQDMAKLLGERYASILQQARDVVDQTKDLEIRAAKVAFLARETRKHLRELRTTRRLIAHRKKLMEFVAGEDRRMEALRVIAGVPLEKDSAEPAAEPVDEEQAEALWDSLVGEDAEEGAGEEAGAPPSAKPPSGDAEPPP